MARARLVLAVGTKGLDYALDDAVLVALDRKPTTADVVSLTKRIRAGEITSGAQASQELHKLIPEPEAPKPPPEKKPAPASPKATPRPPVARPAQRPAVTRPSTPSAKKEEAASVEKKEPKARKKRRLTREQQAEEHRVEVILTQFRDDDQERAMQACEGFEEQAERKLDIAGWDAVFAAADKAYTPRMPESRVLYLEHALKTPQHMPLYTDIGRLDNAQSIRFAVFGIDNQPSPEERQTVFRCLYLRDPQTFDLVTGEKSGDIKHAIWQLSHTSGNEEDMRRRIRFLNHMFSKDDPERQYLNLTIEGGRVHRGTDMVSWLENLGAPNAFERVFIRPPQAFAQATSENAHWSLQQIRDDRIRAGVLLKDLGDYRPQHRRLIATRPEALANFAEGEGDERTWVNRIPALVQTVSQLADGEKYLGAYFQAMTDHSVYAQRLSSPPVIDHTIALVLPHVRADKGVKPSDEKEADLVNNVSMGLILRPSFMSLDPKDQDARLAAFIKRMKARDADGRLTVEKTGKTRGSKGGDESDRKRIEAAGDVIFVHGHMIPNPDEAEGIVFPASIRPVVHPHPTLKRSAVGEVRKLPYEQRQIVWMISNQVHEEQDATEGEGKPNYQIPVSELRQLMRPHPFLGPVYDEDERYLTFDLGVLTHASGPLYWVGGQRDVVGLKERMRNVSQVPKIGPEGEEELIAIVKASSRHFRVKDADAQVDQDIVLATAKNPREEESDYYAKTAEIVARCPQHKPNKVERRIENLVGRGILVNPKRGGVIIISPQIIFASENMSMPQIFVDEFLHVVDSEKAISQMYTVRQSGSRSAVAKYHGDVAEKAGEIDRAIALITTDGGDINKAPDGQVERFERRKAELRALTAVSVALEHGGKLSTLKEAGKAEGVTVGEERLKKLVAAGILVKPTTDEKMFYRISPKYWRPQQQEEVVYEGHDTTQLHPNLDAEKLTEDVRALYEKPGQRKGPMSRQSELTLEVLALISHQHRRFEYGARLTDWLEFLRLSEFPISEGQLSSDAQALTKPVSEKHETVGGQDRITDPGCPALIKKEDMGKGEVYYRLVIPD